MTPEIDPSPVCRLAAPASPRGWLALLLLSLLALPALSQDPAPAAPPTTAGEPAGSPFTNAIPRSVFRDLPDERDPFSPIGYVKPRPPKPGEAIAPPKPIVDFENYLVITGISSIGNASMATLATGLLLEPGETYPIKDKEGNRVAEYKVISITEEKVIALFEGKEYEFKVRSSDLERFIEKEDPNEKKKP